MIEFHAITPNGRELVAQVIDGKLVIPPAPEPKIVGRCENEPRIHAGSSATSVPTNSRPTLIKSAT